MAPPRTSSARRHAGRKLGSVIRIHHEARRLIRYIDELKLPPSSRRFCPTMNPILAEHRNAHASPNSAGLPTRPGWRILRVLLHQFVHRTIGRARRFLEAAAQPVGQERARQDIIDDHVVAGDLARQAGDETGEAGTRAVAHAEFRDWRLHRSPT